MAVQLRTRILLRSAYVYDRVWGLSGLMLFSGG